MSVTHNIERTSVSRTEAALSHAASAFSLLINRLDWSKVNPLQVPLEVVIEAEREVIAASYASRAESTALRAALAAAEKQRDEANKPWNFRLMLPDPVDTYDAVDCRLVDTGHFDRLLILESGELNERLEELTASRDALAAELAEARKVLDRLPKTADGVIVVPELDGVFHAGFDSEGDIERSGETEWVGMFYAVDADGTGTVWTYPVSECYSTREAALAARDSAGKASGGGATT